MYMSFKWHFYQIFVFVNTAANFIAFEVDHIKSFVFHLQVILDHDDLVQY
jgi:hypothetical protein